MFPPLGPSEQIRDYMRREYDRQILVYITEAIRSEIQPFDPGLVELQLILDHIRPPMIVITATNFIDDPVIMDGRELYSLPSEADMAAWVGSEAGKYFRSRMDEPVPDNIILGEELYPTTKTLCKGVYRGNEGAEANPR